MGTINSHRPELRIPAAIRGLLLVEEALVSASRRLAGDAALTDQVRNLLEEIAGVAESHRSALATRLGELAGDQRSDGPSQGDMPRDAVDLQEFHPGASALRRVHALVSEALAGYATLQPLAHRLRDSWVVADEGTTAHIARAHTQEYLAVLGGILESISDVVRDELESQGFQCRCTCPSCGFGICVCATSARSIVSYAWAAARPPAAEAGVEIPPPRNGSSAETSGLRGGDVVLSIDGTRIDTHAVLQDGLRRLSRGDQTEFEVLRTGRRLNVIAHALQDRAESEDDCIEPAGQPFMLKTAASNRDRLHQPATVSDSASLVSTLSAREAQVLGLIAEGCSNPRIATQLGISRATVARHVANILAKLRASNRAEAAGLAARSGFLTVAE